MGGSSRTILSIIVLLLAVQVTWAAAEPRETDELKRWNQILFGYFPDISEQQEFEVVANHRDTNEVNRAYALLRLGFLYQLQSKFVQAEDAYIRALAIKQHIDQEFKTMQAIPEDLRPLAPIAGDTRAKILDNLDRLKKRYRLGIESLLLVFKTNNVRLLEDRLWALLSTNEAEVKAAIGTANGRSVFISIIQIRNLVFLADLDGQSVYHASALGDLAAPLRVLDVQNIEGFPRLPNTCEYVTNATVCTKRSDCRWLTIRMSGQNGRAKNSSLGVCRDR